MTSYSNMLTLLLLIFKWNLSEGNESTEDITSRPENTTNIFFEAFKNTTVKEYENITVEDYENTTVENYENITVENYENITVEAFENTTAETFENTTVEAFGNITVKAFETTTVETFENTTVEALENTTAEIFENTTVKAFENTTSAHVSARDEPNDVPITDQGTVSRQQHLMIEFVITSILKPIVCLVGFVLNVIGICVLLQPELRHGLHVYLVTLSVADSLYLLSGLIKSVVVIYGSFDFVASHTIMAKVYPYINEGFEIPIAKISAYSIILFSLDRLLAITWPLKVKDYFISRRSKWICLTLVIFTFIFFIPRMTNFEPFTVFNKETNMNFTAQRPVEHKQGSTMGYFMTTYSILSNIIFLYLPPVLVCIINIGIIVQMQRSNRTWKHTFPDNVHMDKSPVGQEKLIATVFTISAFFLAVYIPLTIVINLDSFNPDFGPHQREHYLIKTIHSCISFGWSINGSIDFIVYLATSQRFRLSLKKMCCRRHTHVRSTYRIPSSSLSLSMTTLPVCQDRESVPENRNL